MVGNKQYTYFVSYWSSNQTTRSLGMGNFDITLPYKIKKLEQIRKIEKELSEINKANCVVVSYQLY